MDSDNSKDSSSNSIGEHSPSKQILNKYVTRDQIVHEEAEQKSESLLGLSMQNENEDEFSSNENDDVVKVKMEDQQSEQSEDKKLQLNTQIDSGTDRKQKRNSRDDPLKESIKADNSMEIESEEAVSVDSEDEARQKRNAQAVPQIYQNGENILEFYEYLRSTHSSTNPWEDPDYPSDVSLFGKNGEYPERFKDKDYTIEFVRLEEDSEDNYFFSTEHTSNIDYQFSLKRGIMNDKFFIGAVLMLFRKKEQFMTNLVIDYANVRENLKAGFCGFSFFINGEWRNITIDTSLPWYQADEMALSIATSNKTSFWLCLIEKAYAKAHTTYDVLNDVSVKNTLVDLTGGISKKIVVKEKMDDSEKKNLFDEIKRCISQKYLVGSMKFDLAAENPDESKSDLGEEDEILPNSIYNILDIQEVDGYRLIYLVNYWNRGKWSKDFGPDDEAWETNKGLKEKLYYEVITDGTFWMRFEDWLLQFNSLYYCRIFPDNWSQFCVSGCWTGNTSGGAPPRNTGMPWTPEKPIDENKIGGLSPTKTFVGGPKLSVMHQQSKNSIISNNSKDFLASANKKSGKTQAFKFNLLPSVDESAEIHNNQDGTTEIVPAMKRTSMFQGTQMKRTSIAPQSMLFRQKSIVQNNLTSTLTLNAKTNLNQTSVSGFKNTGLNPSQTKSQLYKVPGDELKNKETFRRVIINDTEDRWFLNPQYKLEIKPGSKLIISLMQEDERLSKNPYQKCNFMIILTVGKYSRVWDLKEDCLIKRASDVEDKKSNREILTQLDYNEILRKISSKKRKKILAKGDRLHVNIVPYLEYSQKYEIEKVGNSRIFKLIHKEGVFWLRIFANDDIYVSELAKPYERSIDYEWTSDSAGGARYMRDPSKNVIVESPHWPINPQYLLSFESNISMKIILRKTTGRFGEEEKVGLILTKPNYEEQNLTVVKKETKGRKNKFNKNDQIQGVLESTDTILESKKIKFEDITRKMSFNAAEWVVESSYSNNLCASMFVNFNKIESPIMLIPTLDHHDAPYNFRLSIYSNRRVELFSLNSEESKVAISEWKESNAGGCHLVQDDKHRRKEEDYSKKVITWLDNPKFYLCFDSKDRLSEVEFEIIISRSESIWKKKIANSIVNSMLGVYIFKYDKEKWREQCINMDKVEFVPKSEISFKFQDTKVDPKGYIIMPSTFAQNVHGPFSIMVKCRTKFTLTPFTPKKIIE